MNLRMQYSSLLLLNNSINRQCVLLTGRPDKFYLDMDSTTGNRLSNTDIEVAIYGNPRLVPGRVGNALNLNSARQQYATAAGHRSSCLGNVDRCSHGLMLSVWVRPSGLLANRAQVLSTAQNGLKVRAT